MNSLYKCGRSAWKWNTSLVFMRPISNGRIMLNKKGNRLQFKGNVHEDHLMYKAKQISAWLDKSRSVTVQFHAPAEGKTLESLSKFLQEKVLDHGPCNVKKRNSGKSIELEFSSLTETKQ